MTVPHKPRLSEIFAAMNGIVCLGVAALKVQDKQELVTLAQDAASLSYDAKLVANRRDGKSHAPRVLEFLKTAQPLLLAHGDMVLLSTKGETGGTAADVAAHIKYILEREKPGMAPRPVEHFMDGVNGRAKKFNASYLPAKAAADIPAEDVAPAPVKKPRALKRKAAMPALAAE